MRYKYGKIFAEMGNTQLKEFSKAVRVLRK